MRMMRARVIAPEGMSQYKPLSKRGHEIDK